MNGKEATQLAALAVLCVTLMVIIFIKATGFSAEKAVLSAISGILGLVAGGSGGVVIGQAMERRNHEPEPEV